MNKLFSFIEHLFTEEDAKEIFGEPSETTEHQDRPDIAQSYDDTCAIRSQQIILRDFGVDISEDQLRQLALQNGWYMPGGGGTPAESTGNILEYCGINVHQAQNCTVYDLMNELAQGHRIIVGVDSGELWADNLADQEKELLEDQTQGERGDHALIVAGIEVDKDNPEDTKVVLTDPGQGDLRIAYPIDKFLDAWHDTNCFMVATDVAAPYQYNSETCMEEPSNIATTAPAPAPEYAMAAADIDMPDNYDGPYYSEGHINTVGTDAQGHPVSYEEFSEAYEHFHEQMDGIDFGTGEKDIWHKIDDLIEKVWDKLFGHDDTTHHVTELDQHHPEPTHHDDTLHPGTWQVVTEHHDTPFEPDAHDDDDDDDDDLHVGF